MGAIRRLLGLEKRDASGFPPRPLTFGDALSLGLPLAFVNRDAGAADLAVAERCRSLISQTLASLPLAIVRKLEGGGSEEATSNPLWRVLNDESSPGVSSFELREALVRDVASSGNGFAEITRDGRGAVSELRYLPARNVSIELLPTGAVRYRVTDPTNGAQRTLLADELVHLKYASRDGISGVDPLTWAKASSTLAGVQADLARSMAERSFCPDLSFEFAKDAQGFPNDEMGESAFKRLKDQLTHRVRAMAHDPMPLLLEGGLTAKAISTSGREAQFHETRLVGLEDIARAYGVPLSVVGLGRQTSYGSLSEESKGLLRDCISPWARRIESQLQVQLLSRESRQQYRLEHDLTALLRGDMPARFTAYATAIQSGFLSQNDVREWEGLPKIEGGDTYLQPLNMAAAAPAPAGGDAK